jgi:outer membrane protein assembly factor BamD (BamD/ComL family)
VPEPGASTEPSTRIGAELSTLEQARAALSAGDPARALSILDDYAARFPHASMASEATVLRIEALVRAGDASAARRVADAFLSANPGSPYGNRVRSLVGTNP